MNVSMRLGACMLAGAAAFTSQNAAAQSQSEFYAGKLVTVVVGFTAGGGYDQYARLLTRHISRNTPGNPDFIVQNLPGAGSLNAVRQVEATMAKDGTVIGAFNPGLITESLTDPEKVKFKFSDVAWIGSITRDFRVCYMWAKTNVKTWDEFAARKEVIFGATGKGTGNYVNGAILRNLFGVNVRQILGFPGSAEQRLALERGELDGDCGSWSSVPVEWIKDNRIYPIVTFSNIDDSPDLPKGVPYLGKFAKTDEQKAVLEMLTAAGELGRPFIMSKSVPADRLKTMRAAFDATMKDPQFLAEAQKQQLPVNPIDGVQSAQIIDRIYQFSPAIVAKAKQVME